MRFNSFSRVLSLVGLAAMVTTSLAVSLAVGGSAEAAVLIPGDPLIPEGLGEGDSFHLVFVTSTRTTREDTPGSGTDTHPISFWNDYVNTVAGGSSLPGVADLNWFVIGSTAAVAAKDNAVVSGPVYRLDHALVANDFADMWDGTIANTITVDESGNPMSGDRWVWTGGASYSGDGTASGSYPLGNGTGDSIRGESTQTTGHWYGHGGHQRRGPGSSHPFYALSELVTVSAGGVPVPIAGVDFEGASPSVFDRNPDDLDPTDGISVSSGNAGGLIDGWNLVRNSDGASYTGLLRNDNGANSAGATSPDFPARLEGNSTGSWSIFIPDDVTLDLDRIEFDVRAATGGSGRDGSFNTSLDGANLLWEDLNLPGRNTGWLHVSVDLSGDLYQNLTDQTVSFNWMTTTSGAIDLDTIQVFGIAGPVIPEPSTFVLAAFGLLTLAFCGRRRRR